MLDSSDRIEKLLALILLESMKDSPQAKKIKKLNIAGFTNAEIADILETSINNVQVRLSEGRKSKIKLNLKKK